MSSSDEGIDELFRKPIFDLEFIELKLEMGLVEVPIKLTEKNADIVNYLQNIGSFDEESETFNVPLFIAHVLLKNNLCEIDIPYFKNLSLALRYILQEQNNPTLQSLPENFLSLLKEKLELLKYINKSNPTPSTIKDAQMLELFLMDLIDVRLSKLFKILRAKEARNLKEVLTNEELLLYILLLDIYKKWLEIVGMQK